MLLSSSAFLTFFLLEKAERGVRWRKIYWGWKHFPNAHYKRIIKVLKNLESGCRLSAQQRSFRLFHEPQFSFQSFNEIKCINFKMMVDSFKTKYFLSICIRVLLIYGSEGLERKVSRSRDWFRVNWKHKYGTFYHFRQKYLSPWNFWMKRVLPSGPLGLLPW